MRIVLGVVLIIAAVVFLIIAVVVPVVPNTADNKAIDDFMARILCNPGESLVREQYVTRDSDGTGYSATIYCINNERQRREATDKWILGSMAIFGISLCAGIAFIIWGSMRAARSVQTTVYATSGSKVGQPGVTVQQFSSFGDSSSPIDGLEINEGGIKFGGMEIRMDSLTSERVQTLRQQMQSAMQSGTGSGDLSSKLRQLQEARDAGLITGDEYERLRKEVLDNLS
ncbi:MAG: SHOCT domain-containing protein [Anaerolineae bacterium]